MNFFYSNDFYKNNCLTNWICGQSFEVVVNSLDYCNTMYACGSIIIYYTIQLVVNNKKYYFYHTNLKKIKDELIDLILKMMLIYSIKCTICDVNNVYLYIYYIEKERNIPCHDKITMKNE